MKTPTLKELEDFTLESYIKLLQHLRRIYKIVPFCEIPQKDDPYLILRHDVDVSLPAALEMAQLERDLEIRSTYFILFSSEFYNMFDGKNVKILRQITKLGHEIGLHYHVSQYRSYRRNISKTLKMQIQLLEHLSGTKVHSIAPHGSWDRDPFATVKGYINSNHPYLLRDLTVHDSCRAWTPVQGLWKLLNDPPKRAQLLTHPENWQDDKIDRETLLQRFIQNLEKETFTLKRKLRRTWLADPFVLEYDRSIKNGDFEQSHNNRECKSNPTLISELRQELNYYNTLFRWYIINTSLGWRIHRILEKIRGSSNIKKDAQLC